jgi:hypothetical protein
MTIASVLGVENGERDGIQIFAVSERRNEKQPMFYEGQADSLAGALLDTRDQGIETVSYAHVEQILIGADSLQNRLSQLLSFCFQNGEQSIESNLWILRDMDMRAAFQGDLDLAKRLSTLKSSGEAGTSLPSRSLRETAAQLADEGVVLIPALRSKGQELIFDSYAIIQNGNLVGYLEEDLARTAAILSGDSVYWTDQIKVDDNKEVTAQLHSRGCSVKPVFQNGKLIKLKISCHVDGKLMEVWSAGKETLHKKVEGEIKKKLEDTVARLQKQNADGADLCRQAGLSAPWHWDAIKRQWQDCFANLPCEITVKAKLTEQF